MTENMLPSPEEIRQLNRDLLEKVLDKAASDPTWKQQLLDDPEAACRAANFPEITRFEEIRQREPEVVGHVMPNPRPYTHLYYCCTFYTLQT